MEHNTGWMVALRVSLKKRKKIVRKAEQMVEVQVVVKIATCFLSEKNCRE